MERREIRPPLTFAAQDGRDEAAENALGAGLNAHSADVGQPGDWTPHYILGRDGEGAIRAGIRFFTAFEWLFVHLLWVAEPYRGQGVGSRLITEAEQTARRLGCRGAYLDTFTFQAPKFYPRLGYREFGRLDDFPPGHSRIFFAKRL